MPTIKHNRKFKYIILGAGPSGLSFANKLLQLGEDSFLVIDKESEPGGLCRSQIVDGSPLDIGGGHFLDVKRKEVLDFVFKFLPNEEWNEFNRISKIRLKDFEIDYPFESNIWQFPTDIQIEYIISIAKAGCQTGKAMPEGFQEWIRWKLGDKIAEKYMIPYNNKIWSNGLDSLGTYWLHKLPNASLRDILLSCLEKKPSGTIPAHAKFLYPKKGGYGKVWKLMANNINDKILFNIKVNDIDFNNLVVNKSFYAEKIIMTIPWTEISESSLPKDIRYSINKLEFISIETAYCDNTQETEAHWIYIPDESISYHRIVNRFNFCPNARGYWTETNTKRIAPNNHWSYINKYAYPLNTVKKPDAIKNIVKWAAAKGVYGLGRWGKWEHMNSDVCIQEAINLARRLVSQNKENENENHTLFTDLG